MSRAALEFPSENALIATALSSPAFPSILGFEGWAPWQTAELEGLFGIPDLVLAFTKRDRVGRLILRTCAFEFKRSDWRRALAQAFRYASFAHYSLVMLDRAHSQPALKGLSAFKTANIGLLTVDTTGEITCHFRPKFRPPYSQPLSRALATRVRANMSDDASERLAAA